MLTVGKMNTEVRVNPVLLLYLFAVILFTAILDGEEFFLAREKPIHSNDVPVLRFGLKCDVKDYHCHEVSTSKMNGRWDETININIARQP